MPTWFLVLTDSGLPLYSYVASPSASSSSKPFFQRDINLSASNKDASALAAASTASATPVRQRAASSTSAPLAHAPLLSSAPCYSFPVMGLLSAMHSSVRSCGLEVTRLASRDATIVFWQRAIGVAQTGSGKHEGSVPEVLVVMASRYANELLEYFFKPTCFFFTLSLSPLFSRSFGLHPCFLMYGSTAMLRYLP